MVGCNRFIRIIVMSLGVYVLVANIILWANDPETNTLLLTPDYYNPSQVASYFSRFHSYQMTHYHGFKWFFDILTSFPGPLYTHGMLMTYSNIISGFNITNVGILDALIALVRIVTTPLMLTMTLAADIVNNIAWFFQFIIPNMKTI